MKILVTGSAGFIGFHVSQFLLNRGDTIVGLDNFNSYYDVKLKEARNKILSQYKNFKCVRINLSNSEDMNSLFADESFDRVCNLAAQAGVRHSLDHPHDYINSNIVGFLNILECCRHFNVPRLVYASSSSVYGGNTDLPFSVKDRVDSPVSLYAASKKSNELMAHSYTHLYCLQTIGLRFFTVYGPWGRPDMAMWLFVEAILNNKKIKVFNNGDMKRDFTYIDDIVKGVVASLDQENLNPYEIFNLGNNNSEDLLFLIENIEKLLGKEAEKEFLPMQMGDVKATYADIESARNKLGFKPETALINGLPEFIQWFKSYFKMK